MAVTITYTDIIDGFDTSISQAQVDLLIAIADGADTCLDANSVPSGLQEILKVSAVRHMLTLMGASGSGKGAVTSESAPSGASRSYKAPSASDLTATSYGTLVKQLDAYGCVSALLENEARFQIRSVGRREP